VGVALDDDFVVASVGELPLVVAVGSAAGVVVGEVSVAATVPEALAVAGVVGACKGEVLDDDPAATAGALPLVVAVGGAAGASAGSLSGGRMGRAVQNHPMICMPGQLKVPELAS